MQKIVECVMNISEGRKRETLDSVAAAIANAPGAFLLHSTADPDHNRAVYSFIGDSTSVLTAAFAAAAEAVAQIDLRTHQGEHPRLGAADVIPLIPIRGVPMEECVGIARRLARKLGHELGLPVFLYEKAATRRSRSSLAQIRKAIGPYQPGGVLAVPDHEPDFGPGHLHPTAGLTVVGARSPLIAFNILLQTADVRIARRIAARIRESGGGLPGVRAMGFHMTRCHQAQVSMNVTDPERASLREIFRLVGEQARSLGTKTEGSEIIGLISRQWLSPEDIPKLNLENFQADQILEDRIENALRAGL